MILFFFLWVVSVAYYVVIFLGTRQRARPFTLSVPVCNSLSIDCVATGDMHACMIRRVGGTKHESWVLGVLR
jgi:hypothetical protein